jgi:hypothetical protein
VLLAKAKDGEISLSAENARWTRENVVGCAQRQHGVDTTRHHLKESQHKWGSWTSRRRFSKPVAAPRPGPRAGRPGRAAPVLESTTHDVDDVSGTPRLRCISRLYNGLLPAGFCVPASFLVVPGAWWCTRWWGELGAVFV